MRAGDVATPSTCGGLDRLRIDGAIAALAASAVETVGAADALVVSRESGVRRRRPRADASAYTWPPDASVSCGPARPVLPPNSERPTGLPPPSHKPIDHRTLPAAVTGLRAGAAQPSLAHATEQRAYGEYEGKRVARVEPWFRPLLGVRAWRSSCPPSAEARFLGTAARVRADTNGSVRL